MKRVWPWIWVALAVVLVVRTGVRERGVITDHLEFGRRLLHGEPLYAPYAEPGDDPAEAKPLHPVYPPSFGLLTAPFSLLPERAARVAWALLQVASLFVICRVLLGALGEVAPRLRPRGDLLLALTLALGSRYVLRDTHGGGGNLVNLALALGAFACGGTGAAGAATLRRRSSAGEPLVATAPTPATARATTRPTARPTARATAGATAGATAAALLLGFSLATKPTLLLLVPLLLVHGRVGAAVGSLAAAAGWLGVALLVHGRGLAPLSRWLEGSLAYSTRADPFATPEFGFPPFTWMNQSLHPAVVRWLGQVPAVHAAEVPGFVPGLGLDNTLAGAVATALALLLVVATFVAAWRWRRSTAARHHVVAAVLALSLLLSPISWKAHHVALLPAFLWLWVAAAERRAWVALAAGYAVLCLAGEELTGKALKNLQQSLYLVTLGTLAMWAFVLWRAARAGSARRGVDADGGQPDRAYTRPAS